MPPWAMDPVCSCGTAQVERRCTQRAGDVPSISHPSPAPAEGMVAVAKAMSKSSRETGKKGQKNGEKLHLVTTPVPLLMEMDVSGSTKMRSYGQLGACKRSKKAGLRHHMTKPISCCS